MREKFQSFILGLGLRYFTCDEIWPYFHKVRNGVQNSPPPEHRWERLGAILKRVDAIRHEFGEPITILSSYRSPEYNSAINGATRSQHVECTALDITAKALEKLKRVVAKNQRTHGGGYGIYDSFLHIDNRKNFSNWKG